MMTEKGLWFRCAIIVSVIATFAWAFEATTGIGAAWVPWAAGMIIVVALGSVAVRAALKNRDIVWSEEVHAEQQRRIRHIWYTSIPTLVSSLGLLVLISLVTTGRLPQWAGGILFFVLLIGGVGLRGVIRRGR